MADKAWYGVSRGDGNMGVSAMWADFYVFTDDPWELAERVAADDNPKETDDLEFSGDEAIVSACLYDPDAKYCSYVLNVTREEDGDWLLQRRGAVPFYDSIDETDPAAVEGD